jgi:hypothetical protein
MRGGGENCPQFVMLKLYLISRQLYLRELYLILRKLYLILRKLYLILRKLYLILRKLYLILRKLYLLKLYSIVQAHVFLHEAVNCEKCVIKVWEGVKKVQKGAKVTQMVFDAALPTGK